MFSYTIKAGSTDVSVVIRIVDSTDGTPETGVVFNTAGIDLEYRRELAASVDITEATLAALTTAHSDGGFLHIGNGYYRLDLPDAAVAAGATGCLVHGVVTGMVVIGCYIQLTTNTVDDVYSRIGAPAGASVSADVAAIKAETATILADTNDIQTRLPAALVSGRMDSSIGAVAANAITAAGINTGALTAAKFAAGAIDAAALAADAGTEIGTAVWATAARTLTANTNLNDLSAAGVRAAVGLASANLDTQLDALPTNAELATALGTADDAVLAAVATVDTVVDAIKAVTDLLPDAGALTSLATQASVNTIDDLLDTEVAAIKTVVDAIQVKTDSLTFTVANTLNCRITYVLDEQLALAGTGGQLIGGT